MPASAAAATMIPINSLWIIASFSLCLSMNFAGTRFFTMLVDTPSIRPEAQPITVISMPPHIIPPMNGGNESIMNRERTSSGLISMPFALTVSPTHAPRRPIGGISTADAKAPLLAVSASFAAASDWMYICVVKTPTIIEAR